MYTHLWRGGSAAGLAAAQLQVGELRWQTRFFKAGLKRRQHFFDWTAGHEDEAVLQDQTADGSVTNITTPVIWIKGGRICSHLLVSSNG